jgi:uncharacterized protein
MKLAILSDIHDNVWTLAMALEGIKDADGLICCGDLCSPFILDQLADGFSGSIHIVFGNNDGDLFRITDKASRRANVQLHGAFFAGELGGKRVAVNHYPEIARPLAESGKYDLVCYGHNHSYMIEKVESTLAINPGALMGYDPQNKREISPTFIIYDTTTGEPLGYRIVSPASRREARKLERIP